MAKAKYFASRIVVSARLSPELTIAVKALASELGTSVNAIVEAGLCDQLRKHGRIVPDTLRRSAPKPDREAA